VPVPGQESEWSCISVKGVDLASFYDFCIRFGNIPTVWWKCSDDVVFYFSPFY